jgi:transcription antitermination factor NusG
VVFKMFDQKTMSGTRWFAVRVKSNHERVVATSLAARDLDTCVPMCLARPGRRKEHKSVALFSGYVFCSFDPKALLPVLTVPGVVNIVSRGRVPEEVDPEEMLAVRRLEAVGLASYPYPYLAAGQRIRVIRGPLGGVEGALIREKGQDRLVISVSLLRRSVVAEVERWWVEPLAEPKRAAA